jgi:nitrogen regulatory protein P-II 1
MYLLVAVFKEKHLDEVLTSFLENGITGATILDSVGIGRATDEDEDIPILVRLKHRSWRNRPYNQTVFSVLESEEEVELAMQILKDICGDFTVPGTGIAFSIPIHRVEGMPRK